MSFDLKLYRTETDGMATLGSLRCAVTSIALCYTLENAWRDNKPDVSCIPVGRHRLRLREEGGWLTRLQDRYRLDHADAMRFHPATIEIVVEGREFVLFHTGNFHRETEGCVLVGSAHGYDTKTDGALSVWNSANTYAEIYHRLHVAAWSGAYLEVINTPGVAKALEAA